MTTKVVQLKKTVRTSAGLCDTLFDEMDLLRNGKSDFHRASSVAKLAMTIVATKRLEIDVANMVRLGKKGTGALTAPVALGLSA